MKISIITLTFPPEPAQHILDLAIKLSKKGHNVTVLTSLPSYPYGHIYRDYKNKIFLIEYYENVKIVRVPVIPSHSKSFLKRGIYYLTNCFFTLCYEILTFHTADIVIVYHPPLTTAFSGIFLKWIRGASFILWIHDMWPETLEVGGIKSKWALNLIGRFAEFFYKCASKIIVLSNGFKKNLIDKGIPSDKIEVIPNWANPDEYPMISYVPATAQKLGMPPGCFYVLYAGNLGEMQGLDAVIKAMLCLTHLQKIHLVFLGTGSCYNDLVALTDELGLEKQIKFFGRVSQKEVPTYYSLADVLLIHIKDNPLFRITIPHKIYEYMMVGKPIVAAIKGDALEEVINAKAGIACEPENPRSIANVIEKFYNMTPKERINIGINAKMFLLRHRTNEVLTNKLEKVLCGIK